MALQPRSRTHQAHAQIRANPVSTSKEGHLVLANIHSSYRKDNGRCERFTTGNYPCKPLMIDVSVIHIRIKIN